jgi:uncharacterized protein YgiM (DUF1202 family)
LEEEMKTKMIIMMTLIAFTFSCGLTEKFGKKEEPAKAEPQQEEVAKKEPEKEKAVSEPTPEFVAPPGKTVAVTGSVVNIRGGPGMKTTVVTKVKKGDTLEVMGEIGNWYNVKLPTDETGWIYKKLVK